MQYWLALLLVAGTTRSCTGQSLDDFFCCVRAGVADGQCSAFIATGPNCSATTAAPVILPFDDDDDTPEADNITLVCIEIQIPVQNTSAAQAAGSNASCPPTVSTATATNIATSTSATATATTIATSRSATATATTRSDRVAGPNTPAPNKKSSLSDAAIAGIAAGAAMLVLAVVVGIVLYTRQKRQWAALG